MTKLLNSLIIILVIVTGFVYLKNRFDAQLYRQQDEFYSEIQKMNETISRQNDIILKLTKKNKEEKFKL